MLRLFSSVSRPAVNRPLYRIDHIRQFSFSPCLYFAAKARGSVSLSKASSRSSKIKRLVAKSSNSKLKKPVPSKTKKLISKSKSAASGSSSKRASNEFTQSDAPVIPNDRVSSEVPIGTPIIRPSTKQEWKALVEKMTDLRKPHLWYPLARQIGPRSIVLHMGPTNSGKTHSAIEELVKSSSGVYCGPLRLLAQEIYQKLNDRGTKCDLLTGQKIIKVEGAKHTACTVEMADLREIFDVAVIDEYQLIADDSRGWAWTRALLGLPARTIHLCGDQSALKLVKDLVKQTGDTLTVKEYQRLSPLKPQSSPIGKPMFEGLSAGDCIVTFSKKDLYRMKYQVEKNTNFQCCVVYGDLPPDTRAEQAALFNNPESGYDILIATDAIGLGLNLNIRRIIFSTIEKFDGESMRQLSISEIKQIAGRAGRFNSLYPVGLVTAVDSEALSAVKKALKVQIGPDNPHLLNREAGLLPQFEQLEALSSVLGGKATFVDVVELFEEMARTDRHYFMCKGEDMKQIANVLQRIPLSLRDLYTFCMAPVDADNELIAAFLVRFAQDYVTGFPIEVPRLADMLSNKAKSKIAAYETAYKIIDLYIWLSYRFQGFFPERNAAEELKAKISQLITNILLYDVASASTNVAEMVRRRPNKPKQHESHRDQRRPSKRKWTKGYSQSRDGLDDDDVFGHSRQRHSRKRRN